MMPRYVPLLLVLTLLAPAPVRAQDDADEGLWSGTAEVSAIATSGNSETRTLGLGGEVMFTPDGWHWLGRVAYVESEANDVLSARSTGALLEGAREFSERLQLYGRTAYRKDRFAGIARRLGVEGGVTLIVADTDTHTLEFQSGIGYTDEQRLRGRNRSAPTLSGTGRYALALSETSELTEEVELVSDLDTGENWRVRNVVALSAGLTSLVSLKLSHQLSYLNDPVESFRNTDTITSMALVARF